MTMGQLKLMLSWHTCYDLSDLFPETWLNINPKQVENKSDVSLTWILPRLFLHISIIFLTLACNVDCLDWPRISVVNHAIFGGQRITLYTSGTHAQVHTTQIGVGWIGMRWNGVEWGGVEWSGVE